MRLSQIPVDILFENASRDNVVNYVMRDVAKDWLRTAGSTAVGAGVGLGIGALTLRKYTKTKLKELGLDPTNPSQAEQVAKAKAAIKKDYLQKIGGAGAAAGMGGYMIRSGIKDMRNKGK